MKYSVIIPAYNAEGTIRRCLESLLNQAHEDAEVIVVNDGSTDTTGEICKEYAVQHRSIRYFEKENGGVASARNLGLDKAIGEYILFVDSDDYVTENYFAVLNAHIKGESDLIMFGKYTYDGKDLSEQPLNPALSETSKSTAELLCDALRKQLLNSVWSKVYRRTIVEQYRLRFDQRLPIGEDKVFAVQYAVHARTAVFVGDSIYVMSLENSQSLSRRQRKDLCDHVLLEHDLLFQAAEQSDFAKGYRKAVSYSFYRSAYTVMMEQYKFDRTTTERRRELRETCCRYARKRVRFFSGFYHWLISLPVRWRLAWVIDRSLRAKRCL